MADATKISIIIPAFNEADALQSMLVRLKKLESHADIIVVDDGSGDNSGELSEKGGARVIVHPYNIGNGAAVKSGIRAAKGEVLIFMDGDGQHDPADIPAILEQLDRYDMVVGARGRGQHASRPRHLMNRIYNRLAAYVTGFAIQDLTSGFRAMRSDTARDLLPLLPNGYSWPTTSTLVLLRSGLSVKYLPVHVRSRVHGCSRIRPVRDGIRFFLIIMKICTLYAPFRIFLPVSGSMFLMGMINYAHTFFSSGRFTNMSALLFSASVVIFMMGLISEQVSQISLLRHQVKRRATERHHINSRDNHQRLN